MILLLTLLAGLGTVTDPSGSAGDSISTTIGTLVEKDSLTVLVTDSGLGGLAVCADLESRARLTGAYTSLHIVFANALPEAGEGYNRMKTAAEKVRVFDDALRGMAERYSPDIILVACNTLSVLIPQTRFAAEKKVPVVGIVEAGVEMVFEKLWADPEMTAILFGTETTIEAGTHKRLLVAKGIRPERIIAQPCPNLANEIETDAQGDVVGASIDMFVTEALEKRAVQGGIVLAALFCTHYGYVATRFGQAFADQGVVLGGIVNPNSSMSSLLFRDGQRRKTNAPRVELVVVSRAVISPAEVASIGGMLEPTSPAVARALREYTLNRELFHYRR